MKRSLPLAFLALMALIAPAISASAPDAEALLKRAFDNYRQNIDIMRSLHNAFGYARYNTDAPFYY